MSKRKTGEEEPSGHASAAASSDDNSSNKRAAIEFNIDIADERLLFDVKEMLHYRNNRIVSTLIGNIPMGSRLMSNSSNSEKHSAAKIKRRDGEVEQPWSSLNSSETRLPALLMNESSSLISQRGMHASLPSSSFSSATGTETQLESLPENRCLIPMKKEKCNGERILIHFSPVTELERHRCIVYQDLWDRGYYITTGVKFGGDFLIYKEEPNICHASAVVVVKMWQERVSTLELIRIARVSGGAKKLALVASVESEDGEPLRPKYLAFQFAG